MVSPNPLSQPALVGEDGWRMGGLMPLPGASVALPLWARYQEVASPSEMKDLRKFHL